MNTRRGEVGLRRGAAAVGVLSAMVIGLWLLAREPAPPEISALSAPPDEPSAADVTPSHAVRPRPVRSREPVLPLPDRIDAALGSARGEIETNRTPISTPERLAERALDVLEDFIASNGLDESSSALDYDNGDGIFQPWELGFQVWEDGQLVAFSTGADAYWSFGYAIEALPASIGELASLRYLDLHDNRIARLPSDVGDLTSLRELYLHRNRLAELPSGMADLHALRVLTLSGNRFEELPYAVTHLGALEELHLGDNPLRALPHRLDNLTELRVLHLGQTPGRSSSRQRGLTALPSSLADLPSLERVVVTGNRLCGDRPVAARSSMPTLFGLSSQSCASSFTP